MEMPLLTGQQLVYHSIGLFVIAICTGYYAWRKNRSPFFWFFIALLIGIIAPILLFFLSLYQSQDKEESNESETISPLISPPDPVLTPSLTDFSTPQISESDRLWYYLDESHTQMGPVSVIALREEWNRGLITPMTFVWAKGMNEWKKVEELPELKAQIVNRLT